MTTTHNERVTQPSAKGKTSYSIKVANRRRAVAQAAKTQVSLSKRLGRKIDPTMEKLARDARF